MDVLKKRDEDIFGNFKHFKSMSLKLLELRNGFGLNQIFRINQ